MATRRKRCLRGAAGEQMPNFLIKQEMEWLAEDSHAPDFAIQELQLDMEPIRFIESEEDEVIPAPQTDECIKAKLVLNGEFRDKMSASEGTCKPHVIALAEDHQPQVCKSDMETCRSSHTPKGNLNIQVLSKYSDKAQSITSFESEFSSRAVKAKSDLESHDSTHAKEFPCAFCDRSYSNTFSLSRHKKVHFEEGCGAFICEVCGSKFLLKGSLENHMARKHLDTAEACEVCHCIHPAEYMRTHMHLAHSTPKYECEICSLPLKTKRSLESHLRTHDTNRMRDIVCDICETTFYEKKYLRSHKRRFAQKDHPKFNCKRCVSSFTRKGDLHVHMQTKHLNKSQPIASAPQTAGHDSREQRLTPVPSKDAGVCIKTELMSDEEFIVERNERDSGSSLTDTTGPPTANEDSVHTKEELTSDEEFLDEGTGVFNVN